MALVRDGVDAAVVLVKQTAVNKCSTAFADIALVVVGVERDHLRREQEVGFIEQLEDVDVVPC